MEITYGKHLPNFTDEEVYNWFGERGVYSGTVEQFKSVFDVFEHKEGIFKYRLKLKRDWEKVETIEKIDGLFKNIKLHDPMECLILREYDDDIHYIDTHYQKDWNDEFKRGDEIEVIENK